MRILMLTPMPPQRQATNGVPLVTHAQLMGLAPNHDITIATVAGPDPRELEAVADLRAAGFQVLAVERRTTDGRLSWQRRAQLVSAYACGTAPWRSVWYWEPQLQRQLDELLSKQHFDLITADDNATGMYRLRTNTPKLLTEHEVRPTQPIDWRGWQRPNRLRWVWDEQDWQRWRVYQRTVWRRFDRIQVFTARDAAAIAQLAPELSDRVRINPFGIDLPAPTAVDGCDAQPNTLVFSGGFAHQPNVDAALWLARAIMPILRHQQPDVHLMLVGSYPPAEVQALAGPDITVTGSVPAVEPYLQRASVILAPIRTGGGMRTKVLQGMAMGKPVVTTTLGAEGMRIDGQLAPLVIADDTAAFAQATLNLLSEPEQCLQLGQQARAYVLHHYSMAAYARRLEAVYAELVQATKVYGPTSGLLRPIGNSG